MDVAASSHEMTITLSPNVDSVSFARCFVAETLRRWRSTEIAGEAQLVDALLVAFELMTGILLSSQGLHTLRVWVVRGRVLVEVTRTEGRITPTQDTCVDTPSQS